MIRLSVNVNKVATIRNARGGRVPSVLDAVRVCVDAGAPGITVHPRRDARHITTADVREIGHELSTLETASADDPPPLASHGAASHGGVSPKRPDAQKADRRQTADGERPGAGRKRVEYNIEGDPRPDLIDLVLEVRPHQCTLVPVRPGEITSQAGWPSNTPRDELGRIVAALKAAGVRVSMFVDPVADRIHWARDVGADRVELYTEPFARAFEQGGSATEASFRTYANAADLAHDLGLGINAGHDLDLKNLTRFRALPYLDEVSIGHALISHALFVGLRRAVRDYLTAVESPVA
ncbi:MAG: pyridoxine 5'-phosphate synthase [Acidobacteria bacterium]|nr:pyridoxine 5'-phosphate synthase [Acidobacteriota bacterium]